MRLFVSYARVDKPFCVQVVNTLDVHETWYDQRLYAGQHWWKEILRRLDWCEGFIYLISTESLDSEYCRREFELARKLGRHIFPVLIQNGVVLPPELAELQYADFSKGITPDAVKTLLNAIYLAEHTQAESQNGHRQSPEQIIAPEEIRLPEKEPAALIGAAAAAMEKNQFDQAVYLLRQAKSNNFTSQFIDLDVLLKEAEAELARQTYLREAEREYRQIAELVKYRRTRRLGCKAFQAFSQSYPDYDPDNLASICSKTPPLLPSMLLPRKAEPAFELPMLDWCEIPAGNVLMENTPGRQQTVYIDAFHISKYPITNAQYQVFLDEKDGYADAVWWDFSPHARAWRAAHPESRASKFKGDERPREMVNWFDAMAFTRWLSARMEATITLPSEGQWVRAARGDDRRVYPWGDKFDKDRCNTLESKLKMTTMVVRYPDGVSPYGVYDMAGNVWEWCLNTKADRSTTPEITSNDERVVHGGSYLGPAQRARISFCYYLKPKVFYASIGFRIVRLDS